ncbi:MAG: hypothetical protein HYV33_05915 [Candidatus Kerfeldbacteria bacterium]|nr:hypothetical protein [Candidatus Kerfeldbacteria bacterium]
MNAKTPTGFSLFEVVVYLAVFALVMVAILTISAQSVRSKTKAVAIHNVNHAVTFVLHRISSDVRSAKTIDANDFEDGLLTLTLADNSTRQYQFTAGAITLANNGGSPLTLTPSNVTIDQFTVVNRTHTNFNTIRTISITVQASIGSSSNRPEFEADAAGTTTITLRQ